MTDLQRLLELHGPALDEEIRLRLTAGERDACFTGMMAYQFGYVDERLQPVAHPGGKRFRPLLCLLACEAAGGAARNAMTAAAAIEILHNFSLVHDDIEDRDATRRHRPTVWKLWGEAQGINIGDGMFALANRSMLEVRADADTVLDLARRFGDTSRALTEGQYADMSFETRADVSAAEYEEMIGNKTGALIEFSLWSGARIAGADAGTLAALSAFGEALGRAFQIQDDIAGIWAAESRTGKQRGKDLQNRKKTLPVLLAAEVAAGRARNVLRQYLHGEAIDTTQVLEALDAAGARALAQERVARLMDSARDSLHSAEIAESSRALLLGLGRELTLQVAASS